MRHFESFLLNLSLILILIFLSSGTAMLKAQEMAWHIELGSSKISGQVKWLAKSGSSIVAGGAWETLTLHLAMFVTSLFIFKGTAIFSSFGTMVSGPDNGILRDTTRKMSALISAWVSYFSHEQCTSWVLLTSILRQRGHEPSSISLRGSFFVRPYGSR